MNLFQPITKPSRFIALVLACALCGVAVKPQDKSQPTKPAQDDEVIRVSTTLVQTDVTVFDKQGKFVEGLKPEQFQLKVNGQPVPISFSELVTTGSIEEKAQLEAARRGQPATVLGEKPITITPPAGRSIFLFLDDFHLDGESLLRTRKTLLNTIDKEITANDRALITAASGQLGIQYLTTDKDQLKATVARIAPRAGIKQISAKPPMSEYAAIAISRGDRQVLDYYADYELKFNQPRSAEGPPDPAVKAAAAEVVKSRAEGILAASSPVAAATLSSLESFVRELGDVPGRKLLFFLSDGFVIENERSMSYQRLRAAAQEAARSGVVIYALNTRGLVTGSLDASDGSGFDSRMVGAVYGADSNAQDVLYTLAADTGGTALINNNDLNFGVRRALEETSKYYLLAWRPSAEIAGGEKIKKIDLAVAGRPDLKVKARRFLADAVSSALAASNAPATTAAPAAYSPNPALVTALSTDASQTAVPASLVLVYKTGEGANIALTASMQFSSSALSYVDVNGKPIANLEVVGRVFDQAGKQVGEFNKPIAISPDSPVIDAARKLVFYNHAFSLPPGKYRVRVGVRDSKSGLIGTATQPVELPEIANGKLALSSLMLNEQLEADDEDSPTEKTGARKGVAQRFARGAHLRFLTYVYNAQLLPANDNEPDINVDVKIMRGNQPLLSPSLRQMEVASNDPKVMPFAADISLEGLPPGEYALLVTVTDQTTKVSSSQRAIFIVE